MFAEISYYDHKISGWKKAIVNLARVESIYRDEGNYTYLEIGESKYKLPPP